MAEAIPIAVGTKTVAVTGTAEELTTRDINCTSVFLLPLTTNTDVVQLVDLTTESQKITIPSTGLTIPISNPALIKIDVAVNGEGLDWVAV
ncbi:hypothetical protein LCGC14_0364200 [marine sediment metagenome]|uniref:Uncharacterized protein n=1 Tax=marine sediment metagenome TaxID=412755 RepID=A0A0F9VUD5_9ZZZZ